MYRSIDKKLWPYDVRPWIRRPNQDPPYSEQPPEEREQLKNVDLYPKRRRFSGAHGRNKLLHISTKAAALKVCPSIVSLQSYTGDEELFECSGTVIESHDNFSIILTSANLLRSLTAENSVAKDIKITVRLPGGAPTDGQIEAVDFHFNLAAVRIDKSLPAALVTHLTDALSHDLNEVSEEKSAYLPPHRSKTFNLIPGDTVTALGRFAQEPYEIMAASGEFCIDRCPSFYDEEDDFNCKELFLATCIITRCGVGGPLINRYGEVIGICFYNTTDTPFLPINVASLWWEHFKKYRQPCRLWLGMEATNLYTDDLEITERVIWKFPCVKQGVLVDEVIPGSSADFAGIECDDVIFQVDGKRVQSFLELFESMWDKVGESVELTVARLAEDVPLYLKMVVEEAAPDNLYRWPHWKYVL